MSVIVGVAREGVTWMACDSAAHSKTRIQARIEPKLTPFYISDCKGLIGTAGSFRFQDWVRQDLGFPKKPKTMSFYTYVYRNIIPQIEDLYSNSHEYENVQNNDILIAWKGHLLRIHSDLQVAQNTDGIDAIGSGSDYALGSLYSELRNQVEPARAVEHAVRVAVQLSPSCCLPLHKMST